MAAWPEQPPATAADRDVVRHRIGVTGDPCEKSAYGQHFVTENRVSTLPQNALKTSAATVNRRGL
jgi:hypothetical protein